MKNAKRKIGVKIAIAIVAILLVSSTLVLLGNSIVISSSIEATPLSPAKDYGDILQYEWTTGQGNENQSMFSAGPGPDRPDILWKTQTSGSGYISVFNGKAFVISGSTLKALDAFTGAIIWTTSLNRSGMGNGVVKLDDTYLAFDTGVGVEVRKISDGSYVSNFTVPYDQGHPGSAQYFPGSWSTTLKMKFILSYDMVTKLGLANAIDLSDPTKPKLAWNYTAKAVSEIQTYGDGRVYIGTTANTMYALNATTGALLWEAPSNGVVQQHGLYYNNKVYHAAATQCVTAWDGATGEVKWVFDASVLGERAYFAFQGGAGYGRYYDCAIPNDPNGWIICLDSETGELLWKQPGYYNIHYATTAVAGGKVYAQVCDQPKGSQTAGLVMPGPSFACFDAFTGTKLWQIPYGISQPSIGYGNLYFATGGYIYCIGKSTPAKPWAFGYVGNTDQPRVAVGGSGPTDISTPKWVYKTGSKIASSPAIANGKVYIGSDDHNLYCLDAYTGKKNWNFTTGYWVGASPAVVGDRVYTGADDGNFYCLNANTGEKIWTRYAGGLFDKIMMPQELQSRSSPIVVGDSLYAGALDGKVYCLNTANGNVRWSYTTGGPIGGSPAYSNGVIFIASTDTFLYAITTAGTLKWKSPYGLNLDVGYGTAWPNHYFCTGTPVVASDTVYVPGGVTYGAAIPGVSYPTGSRPNGAWGAGMRMTAFNATTGAGIWNQTITGNSGGVWVPTYFNGQLYIVENMRVSSMNAVTPNSGKAQPIGFAGQVAGNRTWTQWIGYQILSSVAYADDLTGPKVYVGCDVGSVTCLNASSGAAFSAYQTGANVEGSPSIWEGKLYIGGTDGCVYCFDDSPTVDCSISAAANKGATMWNNETITIKGRLISNPIEMTYDKTVDKFLPVASNMHPGLPDATVMVSLTKPDMTSVNLTTTTDNTGHFSLSYNPNVAGDWGWVAYYPGKRTDGITYNVAYAEWNPFEVTAPPSSGGTSPTPTPTPAGGIPVEYVYAAVTVIAIAIIAIGAYAYTKRTKK